MSDNNIESIQGIGGAIDKRNPNPISEIIAIEVELEDGTKIKVK